MDHPESVLVNDPVDVFPGNGHVEIKPQGVSKGTLVEMLLGAESATHLRATGTKVGRKLAVGDDARTRRCSTPASRGEPVIRREDSAARGLVPDARPEAKHDHLAVYLSTVGQKPSKRTSTRRPGRRRRAAREPHRRRAVILFPNVV